MASLKPCGGDSFLPMIERFERLKSLPPERDILFDHCRPRGPVRSVSERSSSGVPGSWACAAEFMYTFFLSFRVGDAGLVCALGSVNRFGSALGEAWAPLGFRP